MLRFLYRSTAVIPPGEVVLDIIRVSDRRNADRMCSGMMIYGSTGYLHVIEGPPGSVRALSRSILRDWRHVVDWWCTDTIARHRIQPILPLGLFDEAEWRGRGVLLQDWGDRSRITADDAPRALRMLYGLAAEKYPSACRPDLLRLPGRRAPAASGSGRQGPAEMRRA